MSISTLMKLNDRFPIGTTKNSDGTTTTKKLFSGYETFSSANEANAFFCDDNNCKSINGILLEDENGNGHMAYVKSYSKGQINFTGYSIFDTQKTSYDGGKIKPNGNFQNGWKIVGVIFKPSK